MLYTTKVFGNPNVSLKKTVKSFQIFFLPVGLMGNPFFCYSFMLDKGLFCQLKGTKTP